MKRAADLSGLLERLIGVLSEIALLTVGPAAILQDMMRSSGKPDNNQIKRTRPTQATEPRR